MARNAIYYPTIEVPADPWLLRMALYWEKLHSIVPIDHAYDPEQLSPKMRDMLSSGLVEALYPSQYMNVSKAIAEPFLRYAIRWKRLASDNRVRWSSVHSEKLHNIVEPLQAMGLVRPDSYPWVLMPQPVANAFLCFLAANLGQLRDVDASPITNQTYGGLTRVGISRSLAREDLLEQLLPVPSASQKVSIDDVLRFREKYSVQAARFRERLEAECMLIASLGEEKMRQAQLHAVATKMRQEIDEVTDAMRRSWKDIAFGTILPVFATTAPLVDADWKRQPYAAVGAAGALAVAVHQAVRLIQAPKVAEGRPLAYAALVRRGMGRSAA